jgi:DNA-binding CsgD family transcriptional regulator
MAVGRPELSPTLAELLETRITLAPKTVRDVLDALAMAEPLETDILAALTDADTLAKAESLGLISVDVSVRPASVRLAHPLLCEVRRAPPEQLRRLRGRIATELARKGSTDPRDLVRRAALTIDSDLTSDPELLLAAAGAAMQLLDLRLAETLAERAVAAGGGLDAKFAYAMALVQQERGTETEAILAELADKTTGPLRTLIAILRAITLAVIFGQTAKAENVVNEMLPADDEDAHMTVTVLRAMIDVARGNARVALDRANDFLATPPANDIAHPLSIIVLLGALGTLGRVDEIESLADRGYRLAHESVDLSHVQFQVAFLQANAYRLAGALAQADATIARIRRDTVDVLYEQSWRAFLAGMSAMSHGALVEAQRPVQEALAYLGTGDMGRLMKALGGSWLATLAGVAGRAADARREFAAIQWWPHDADACEWDSEKSIAQAWVFAAEDAVSQAISITRGAAERERRLDRPAWEVLLLQTATQFGDHTTAARLAELADEVQGPRAPAAAAHAAALATGSADALLAVSRQYEEFGDRLAAADAAAHAVVAYQDAGSRGAALSASATAQRLAAECQGAQTPALRAAATASQPFTARQLEIISLAAQGLSNKEIADGLTMSIRSVEGHLFRACQRVGATGRDELISILRES